METVLITGANGFVGRRLVQQLIEFGYFDIVAISDNASVFRGNSTVKCLKYVDFLNNYTATSYYFMHLASCISGSKKKIKACNIDLADRLLKKAKQDSCKKFIFTSSYDLENEPLNYYGKSKLYFEKKLQESNLPYLIFRPSVIFGANDTKNFNKMFQAIHRSPVVPLLNSGKTLCRPIWVKELVEWLLNNFQSQEGIFTIISKECVSFKEIIDAYLKANRLNKIKLPIPFNILMPPSKTAITNPSEQNVVYLATTLIEWIKSSAKQI